MFQAHVDQSSSSSQQQHHCPQCLKGFKELRTLRLHLKIHNAEYPERCGVCAKAFRTKWQLKQHQMDHGGERPYPCPECTFTCKTKQQLNEHRRKHSVSGRAIFHHDDRLINLAWWKLCCLRSAAMEPSILVGEEGNNLSTSRGNIRPRPNDT